MGTRQQTLYRLAGSLVALAARLLHHGDGYAQPAAVTSAVAGRTIGGHSAGDLTRNDVLDNITLYWLRNTGFSVGRLHWENKIVPASRSPGGHHRLPAESFQAPRSWAERAYHKLIYFNRVDNGDTSQPGSSVIFSTEARAAFRPLRQAI